MRFVGLALALLLLLTVAAPVQAQDCFEAERSSGSPDVGFSPYPPPHAYVRAAGYEYRVYLLNCGV